MSRTSCDLQSFVWTQVLHSQRGCGHRSTKVLNSVLKSQNLCVWSFGNQELKVSFFVGFLWCSPFWWFPTFLLLLLQTWGLASTCPNGILEQCLATRSIARWRSQQPETRSIQSLHWRSSWKAALFPFFISNASRFFLSATHHAQVLQLTT